MVENVKLHEDFVEFCNELYASQHDSFQKFDFISLSWPPCYYSS